MHSLPASGQVGTREPGTHRLVLADGVLDAPTALWNPRGVEHGDGWHPEYWRGQSEVDAGRRDLPVDSRGTQCEEDAVKTAVRVITTRSASGSFKSLRNCT